MRAGHRCEGRGSDTVFISYFLVETTQQLFTFANKSETVRSYQPYPWLISTTYMALINHIHGSYQPHQWLLSTTSMALINHIHGSYQPHPRRLHWSRQPSIHKEQKWLWIQYVILGIIWYCTVTLGKWKSSITLWELVQLASQSGCPQFTHLTNTQPTNHAAVLTVTWTPANDSQSWH